MIYITWNKTEQVKKKKSIIEVLNYIKYISDILYMFYIKVQTSNTFSKVKIFKACFEDKLILWTLQGSHIVYNNMTASFFF